MKRPLRPYLSNLDSNLKVCLGLSFDRSKLIKDKLAQQTAFVLDHFWHSAFSDEWSAHYWDNKIAFHCQRSDDDWFFTELAECQP
jgi:hypothetical protein